MNKANYNTKKNERGITLIALVITIIVLVILVGVTLNTVINKGLINNSKTAVSKTATEMNWEKMKLAMLEVKTSTTDSSIDNEDDLGDILDKNGIEVDSIEKKEEENEEDNKFIVKSDGVRYLIDENLSVRKLLKIVCWGDSLTAGTGGNYSVNAPDTMLTDKVTYPKVLQSLCYANTNEITAEVYNMGMGGENTATIAGRQGGLPYKIAEDFTIPETKEKVVITFEEEDFEAEDYDDNYKDGDFCDIVPYRVSAPGLNTCFINGVEGTITAYPNDVRKTDHTYYFTRKSEGEAVEVKSGTEVITQGMIQHKDADILIIWTGTNDGNITSNIDEIIETQKKMIDYAKNVNNRYIIIGLHGVNDKFKEAYDSDHFFSLDDNGLRDETKYLRPYPDLTHFTREGYQKIGELIFQKLIDLEYIK